MQGGMVLKPGEIVRVVGFVIIRRVCAIVLWGFMGSHAVNKPSAFNRTD